jgi:NADH-quinone oxidoreductase subunit N
VTAFVSTASKVAGFVLLYRLLANVFPTLVGAPAADEAIAFGGWTGVLALVALLTLVWGNLGALPQMNAKRLLAYSGIAHAGFLLLGIIAWAAPLAIDRALGTSALIYYLITYTLMNVGAFGVLAVVLMRTGGDDLRHLNGLAQRNLPLAVLFTIFVFSLAGIPPTAGFFAKFYIFMAGWQSGAIWLVVVGIIATIVSLYYYLRLLRAVFLQPPSSTEPLQTPGYMNAVLVITAVLVLALGLYPSILLQIIEGVQVAMGG